MAEAASRPPIHLETAKGERARAKLGGVVTPSAQPGRTHPTNRRCDEALLEAALASRCAAADDPLRSPDKQLSWCFRELEEARCELERATPESRNTPPADDCSTSVAHLCS